MTIYLKAFRSSLKNKEGKKLFHPRVVLGNTITLETIVKDISSQSKRSFEDTLDICQRLLEVTSRYLCESHPVKFSNFGVFTPIVFSSGKGVEREEDVNTSLVSTTCFKFRSTSSKPHSTNSSMCNIPIKLAMAKEKVKRPVPTSNLSDSDVEKNG